MVGEGLGETRVGVLGGIVVEIFVVAAAWI